MLSERACWSPTHLTDASANSRAVFNESILRLGYCNEEGNFVRLFHLRHCEPEMTLQRYQAGHRMPDGLGGGFGGA